MTTTAAANQESIAYYTNEISALLATINHEKTYQTLFQLFFKMCQMCSSMEGQIKAQRTAEEHAPLSGKPAVIVGGCKPKKRSRKPKLELVSCGGER